MPDPDLEMGGGGGRGSLQKLFIEPQSGLKKRGPGLSLSLQFFFGREGTSVHRPVVL